MASLLQVTELETHYVTFGGARVVKAVDRVSFALDEGETLGIVGESGCGKTTTAKLILLQETPSAGTIRFDGKDVAGLAGAELMRYRRAVQVVFQDPYSSLSPRMRVGEIIAEPLQIHTEMSREEQQQRVGEVLDLVGLGPESARLFPHEFSGGQRQRIAIARALVTNTRLVVLDEPVSALDVSIRAQIINQLEELQAKLGVSYLFIGHDLATVAHISRRIAVMYLGQVVELADALELCDKPLHPYTQALFAAALPAHPDDKRERVAIKGEVPSALAPPSGCRFHPRCPFAMPRCTAEAPLLKTENAVSRAWAQATCATQRTDAFIAVLHRLTIKTVLRAAFTARVNFRRAGAIGQLTRAAHQVGVNVGFKNVGNGDAVLARQLEINFDVRSRIDYRSGAFLVIAD